MKIINDVNNNCTAPNFMYKRNRIRNIAVFSFLSILLFTECYADVDVKLDCDLTITETHINGAREQQRKHIILDIVGNDRSGYFGITSMTDDIASVSTKIRSPGDEIQNFNNDGRWDIRSVRKSSGNISDTRISIDRNTGQMGYYRDWNNGRIISDGNGICSKIDVTKRKF